jgi:hypothetical protein
MAALGVAGAIIPSQTSASVAADNKTKDGVKAHRAPTGTALIVYVAEDGNIIEAIEPSGVAPQFEDKNMADFAGFKFRTGGHDKVFIEASASLPGENSPGHELISDDIVDSPSAPGCWCKIGGQWYCRLSCC